VPEAKIASRNSRAKTIATMVDFVAHKFDVLVATTIVEQSRYSQREHDHHQPADRTAAQPPTARARRTIRSPGVPTSDSASRPCTDCAAARRRFANSAISAAGSASPRDLEIVAREPAGLLSRAAINVGFDVYRSCSKAIRELKGEELEDSATRRQSASVRIDRHEPAARDYRRLQARGL
jgi:hypothetical protein